MNHTLTVSRDIRERHPEVAAQGIVVEGLHQASKSLNVPTIAEVRRTLAGCSSNEKLAQNQLIASWRDAISLCGLKPSRYRSSVEALARRVIGGQAISTPLPIVDLYCAISVMNLAPLGGYDLELLPTTTIELRLARPLSDQYQPLGAEPSEMVLSDKIAVHAADNLVLCYAYNHRDSRATCLRTNTDRALFLGEATTAAQGEALRSAMRQLREHLAVSGARITEDLSA